MEERDEKRDGSTMSPDNLTEKTVWSMALDFPGYVGLPFCGLNSGMSTFKPNSVLNCLQRAAKPSTNTSRCVRRNRSSSRNKGFNELSNLLHISEETYLCLIA